MMKKRILCLAMALMMMVGTFSTVQAKELVGKDHWKVSFDGSQMTTNFGKNQMNDELSNIQPGDSMTLKVKIKNIFIIMIKTGKIVIKRIQLILLKFIVVIKTQ